MSAKRLCGETIGIDRALDNTSAADRHYVTGNSCQGHLAGELD